MSSDPLICERCHAGLACDDAVSIIEGLCLACRRTGASGGFASLVQSLSVVAERVEEIEALPDLEPLMDEAGHDLAEDVVTGKQATRSLESEAEEADAGDKGDIPAPLPGREDISGKLASTAWHPRLRSVTPAIGRAPLVPAMLGPIGAMRARRRRRDLVIGVGIGLLVTVSLTGYFWLYRPWSAPLALAPAKAENPMTLAVTPAWARVMLDGRELGPADEKGRLTVPMPAGDPMIRWLEISADGYHSVRRPLASYSGVKEVSVELVRKPYEVIVRTKPPQAEVWLGDEYKGTSPLTLTLLPTEERTLVVKRAGYAEISQRITPPARGTVAELDLTLASRNVTVEVETEPPGAMIAMDGIVRGPSPLAVEMDPSYWGKELEITASLAGYEDAATVVAIPPASGDKPVAAKLSLAHKQVAVEFWTVPPGGSVSVDGREVGTSPVTVPFSPTRKGTPVMVSASLGGTHYGRQEVILPPPGELLRVSIPMGMQSRRVVFVVCAAQGKPAEDDKTNSSRREPSGMKRDPQAPGGLDYADHLVLLDQVVEAIHALPPEQRLAVLIGGNDGVEVWPGGLGTESASNEQKVRAYDLIRSVRPGSSRPTGELLRLAMGFQPNVLWLFVAGEVGRDDLLQFSDYAKDGDVTVHLVQASPGTDDEWLRGWAATHHGTFTVLGQDQLPGMALQQGGEDGP